MVVWNKGDYESLQEGKYANYWGHTFLFKRFEVKNKSLYFWDQKSITLASESKYIISKDGEIDDFDNNIFIGVKYYNKFYDLEDTINAISKEK